MSSALAVLLLACTSKPPGDRSPPAGTATDAAEPEDTASVETGMGEPDSGDSGETGTIETGGADTGRPDTGAEDTASPDTGRAELPDCPTFDAPSTAGLLLHIDVAEASGLAASRRNPGTLWTHNDSGDSNRIFALSSSGVQEGTFELEGAEADDWEDIAVGPGPDPSLSYVYVGDIGANDGQSELQVYRVAEPELGSAWGTTTLDEVERLEFRYPDGEHNAETMLVDPVSGDLYVVTKSGDGESGVYRAAAPLASGAVLPLTRVAALRFGADPLAGDPEATGGDFSAAGDLFVVRTYDSAFAWRRPSGWSVEEALAMEPCGVPQAEEGMGEALGFAADDSGYFTVGEGRLTVLSFYARR